MTFDRTTQPWRRETWNLLYHDHYPLLMALANRWAYVDDGYELSRLSKVLNTYYHLTRWVRLEWWKAMLEAPALSAERRGTSRLKVTLCRMRGHAPRIYYSSGMEPDDRCSRCLEEY